MGEGSGKIRGDGIEGFKKFISPTSDYNVKGSLSQRAHQRISNVINQLQTIVNRIIEAVKTRGEWKNNQYLINDAEKTFTHLKKEFESKKAVTMDTIIDIEHLRDLLTDIKDRCSSNKSQEKSLTEQINKAERLLYSLESGKATPQKTEEMRKPKATGSAAEASHKRKESSVTTSSELSITPDKPLKNEPKGYFRTEAAEKQLFVKKIKKAKEPKKSVSFADGVKPGEDLPPSAGLVIGGKNAEIEEEPVDIKATFAKAAERSAEFAKSKEKTLQAEDTDTASGTQPPATEKPTTAARAPIPLEGRGIPKHEKKHLTDEKRARRLRHQKEVHLAKELEGQERMRTEVRAKVRELIDYCDEYDPQLKEVFLKEAYFDKSLFGPIKFTLKDHEDFISLAKKIEQQMESGDVAEKLKSLEKCLRFALKQTHLMTGDAIPKSIKIRLDEIKKLAGMKVE